MDYGRWNEWYGLWTEVNKNETWSMKCGLKEIYETWTMKCGLKEMRWNMNNEVKNVIIVVPPFSHQGFNRCHINIIFSTEMNFPIRSRYVFYSMFSPTFRAFVTFMTFLLFQSNLYIVLAHGKGPKIAFIEIFSRQKTLYKDPPHPQLHFTHLTVCR